MTRTFNDPALKNQYNFKCFFSCENNTKVMKHDICQLGTKYRDAFDSGSNTTNKQQSLPTTSLLSRFHRGFQRKHSDLGAWDRNLIRKLMSVAREDPTLCKLKIPLKLQTHSRNFCEIVGSSLSSYDINI